MFFGRIYPILDGLQENAKCKHPTTTNRDEIIIVNGLIILMTKPNVQSIQ